MKRQITATVLTLLWVLPLAAGERKILTDSISAESVEAVSIDAGVGSVTVTAADGDVILVEVKLEPRRGGFFSSMKKAEDEVDAATLIAEVVGRELYLDVESLSDNQRFEETWSVQLPSRMELLIDHGVGDVEVRGLAGGLDLEIGVGDVTAEVSSGDVAIDLGVGDARVEAPIGSYGSVEASGGVGDARIKVRGERIESEGFVGHKAAWRGDGEHRIEVEVGIGDALIVLE